MGCSARPGGSGDGGEAMLEEADSALPRGSRGHALRMTALVLLRVAIGWHFLYEGLAKLYAPNWTSAGYLEVSRWVFAPLFHWIAAHAAVLRVVDLLNMWGLTVIGVCLMLGCLTRLAAAAAALLLLLYYVANPPLVGMDFGVPAEGHYLIVNKNLVELVALVVVLIFPTGRFLGLDRIIHWALRRRQRRAVEPAPAAAEPPRARPAPAGLRARREVLAGLAGLPFLGAFVAAVAKAWGWESFEERNLAGRQPDAVTGATIKTFDFSSLKDLKGPVPSAAIGGLGLSRMILGGNLIGGWAHARDLIYVSKLVKAYHHRDKVFETLLLAEKCSINAILTNPALSGVINEYWRRGIGRIRFISDCAGRDLLTMVRKSIDNGASACYVQGGVADELVLRRKFDVIARAMELTRAAGLPAGIGAHKLSTIQACAAEGLKPDFWMKTFHNLEYWSARTDDVYDNVWCVKPAETVAFMKDVAQPWIAFKVLAAGAIDPEVGFRQALEAGADFLCVGMYDFQIVEDVNTFLGVWAGGLNRRRPWRA